MKRIQCAGLLALVLFAAGCQQEPVERAQATPVAASDLLIVGTPEGDLEQWANDVRKGLETAAGKVDTDRAAVQKQVLDLYVGRQEYMEMYYGPTGRMKPAAELADAVKTAEDRFHELMIATGSTPPAEAAVIRNAIAAVDKQLAVVLSLSDRSERRVRGAAR